MTDKLDPIIVNEIKRISDLLIGAQELLVSIEDIEKFKYSDLALSLNYNAHFLLMTAIDNLRGLSDSLEEAIAAKGAA